MIFLIQIPVSPRAHRDTVSLSISLSVCVSVSLSPFLRGSHSITVSQIKQTLKQIKFTADAEPNSDAARALISKRQKLDSEW